MRVHGCLRPRAGADQNSRGYIRELLGCRPHTAPPRPPCRRLDMRRRALSSLSGAPNAQAVLVNMAHPTITARSISRLAVLEARRRLSYRGAGSPPQSRCANRESVPASQPQLGRSTLIHAHLRPYRRSRSSAVGARRRPVPGEPAVPPVAHVQEALWPSRPHQRRTHHGPYIELSPFTKSVYR